MAEIYRKLEITFSKAEIQAILAARALEIALKRKGVKTAYANAVSHVEGEATVAIYVGNLEKIEVIEPWLGP